MSKVTVYNKTKENLDFLLHGEPQHLEMTTSETVGQIVVTEKRAKEILKMFGDKVTLNRGDLSGAVNKDIQELKAENAKLAEEVLRLNNENKTLKTTLQEFKDDIKRAAANKKAEENKKKE